MPKTSPSKFRKKAKKQMNHIKKVMKKGKPAKCKV